ncbi:MAG: hypothetical protein AAFY59_12470, partial [Pseudomonadota bacterium]
MVRRGMIAALMLVLAACSGGLTARQITTEADFRSEIVGRTLSNGAVTLQILSPGVLGGIGRSGTPVVGTWTWDDGRFCRNIVSGGSVGNGCQTVLLTGTAVTFLEATGGV